MDEYRQTTNSTPLNSAQQEELEFWRLELQGLGAYPETVTKRLSPELRYSEYPVEVFVRLERELKLRPIKVLELGSGPLSTLAYGATTGQLDVTAVDVLADYYQELLSQLHITYPVIPLSIAGESLSDAFAPASFDCAFARNSLDHTEDPLLTFSNLYRLVRPGGYIYLVHAVYEGAFNKWSPSHRWNLDFAPKAGLIAASCGGRWHSVAPQVDLTPEYIVYAGPRFGRVLEILYSKQQ